MWMSHGNSLKCHHINIIVEGEVLSLKMAMIHQSRNIISSSKNTFTAGRTIRIVHINIITLGKVIQISSHHVRNWFDIYGFCGSSRGTEVTKYFILCMEDDHWTLFDLSWDFWEKQRAATSSGAQSGNPQKGILFTVWVRCSIYTDPNRHGGRPDTKTGHGFPQKRHLMGLLF